MSRKFVAATEKAKPSPADRYGDYVRVRPGERLFLISDELAAEALMDWSEPVQLRLENRAKVGEAAMYDLVARKVKP